jgi:hypothetical protein
MDAIRGDEPYTESFLSARIGSRDAVKLLFTFYFDVLDISRVPLIRTPDTQEGKKFKLEESPWKIAYPYEPRK